MRLLVVTQTVDEKDPVLGFFHGWLKELSSHVEKITVICLKEGAHALPENVTVHSLGKEKGRRSPYLYVFRFKMLAWKYRTEYDVVFVHMNQEYILIAGPLWKLLGKRIYLWRNHYAGGPLTDIAAAFCTKVFCTSKYSYTAKYKKTELMPVGVDTHRFKLDGDMLQKPRSILFLGRMSPSKRPEMLLDALAVLTKEGVEYHASLIGSPLPEDAGYYEGLKGKARTLGISERVLFSAGVPNADTPVLYGAHAVFVNCSPSGMLDKTLFEAAACGCRVLAASGDFAALAGPEAHFETSSELAERLKSALTASKPQTVPAFVAANSLDTLGAKLVEAL